ncbi:MAG TPA: hypothetical protein VLV45_09925 [Gemmatimonadales bacterium]|nr:hypothetical protein [Gemmatimonadales bacterium]
MRNYLVVMAAGLFAVGACKTVEPIGYPAEFVATRGPSHVWVTNTNGNETELWNPTVHGDTLAGFNRGAFTEIPLGDIKLMRAPIAAPARTALLAGGLAIGSAATVALLMGSGTGSTCITPGTDFVSPCVNPNNPDQHIIN